jgi:hypothetical protein
MSVRHVPADSSSGSRFAVALEVQPRDDGQAAIADRGGPIHIADLRPFLYAGKQEHAGPSN